MLNEDEVAIMYVVTPVFPPPWRVARNRLALTPWDCVHRETARDYCQEKLQPRVVEAYRTESES
jgi:hypothetical protein